MDGQRTSRAHVDGTLDLVVRTVRWCGVEDLDPPAFGHPEVVRRLDFAHRVALTQVQVGFNSKTHCYATFRLR